MQSLWLLAFLALGLFHFDGARAATLDSISKIRDFMYQDMRYTGGWYTLLNTTHEIGSRAPVWGEEVEGVLMNASHVTWPLTERRLLVCNLTNMEPLLLRLLNDATSRSNVVGVLVDPQGVLPPSMSSAETFPSSFNAPYSNTSYPWNPYGTGLGRRSFPFPVTLMSRGMALQTAWRAAYNNRQHFNGALYWGNMRMDMNARYNSTFCLGTGTCKALGGVSVWAAIPPMQPLYPDLNVTLMQSGDGSLVAPSTKPITLVVAQLDSDSLFHDYTQGSDSPLSGLIAMMAAMEALRQTNSSSNYTRQLVFLVLAGEPWDYMGSRRLMFEMYINSTSVSGLDLNLIDQVIEIGMVGRAYNFSSNTSTLYLHTQKPGGGYGNTSALVAALQQGAGQVNQTNQIQVVMNSASSSNPGIPPSSLMTFLRHKPSIQGVVITEFDQQYTNPYFRSEQDIGGFLTSDALVATGLALARTLHTLASPDGVAAPLSVNLTTLQDLTLRLALCLMVDGQPPLYSLRCSTVTSYLNQVSGYNRNAQGEWQALPWRYVGLMMPTTPDPTNVTNIQGGRDIFKFLFQWMANTTASNHTSIICDPFVNFCPSGMACLGWIVGQNVSLNNATMGRCKVTTTRIVQAASTRMVYVNRLNGYVRYLLSENDPTLAAFNTRYNWPPDPLWTESDWTIQTPYVKVYMKEPKSTQVAILVSGLLLTVATALAAYLAQKAFERRIKSD